MSLPDSLGRSLAIVLCLVGLASAVTNVAYALDLPGIELTSAPATRSIAVSGATPVLTPPASMKVLPGQTVEQLVTATDARGDALIFSKGSGPDYMTVTTVDPGSGTAVGRIRLEPMSSAVIDVVTASVVVSDGVLSDEEFFTIVSAKNPPVLRQPDNMQVEPRRVGDQALHATDADDDPLHFSLALGPWFVSVTTEGPGSGNVHVTPVPADSGAHQVSISVSDGIVSDVRTFTVLVPAKTTPILAPPADMNVAAGQIVRQLLTVTDADQQVCSLYKVEGPEFMAVRTHQTLHETTHGTIELTPQLGHSPAPEGGEFHIPATIGVTDGVRSEEKSFTIHATFPPDRPPVLRQPEDMTLQEEHFGYQDYFASDPDGEYVTVTKVSGPDFLAIAWAIFVEPDLDDAGEYLATIRATDPLGLYDEKTFRIVVLDSPSYAWFTGRIDDMALFAGHTAEQEILAMERDGLPVSFSMCSGPEYAMVSTIDPGTGSAKGLVRLSPGSTDVGCDTVNVCLWNGVRLNQTSIRVEVFPPGRPGLMGIGDPCMAPGDSIGFRFRALDPEGDPLSFSHSAMPPFGTFADHGDGTATLILWPQGSESRGVTFLTVTASDGITSDTEIFAVNVGWCGGVIFGDPPNHFPEAKPGGPYTGFAGNAIAFDATGSSDRDGQALSYAWSFGDGSVAMGPTVAHEYQDSGEYSVELIVSDGNNSTRAATVATVQDAPPGSQFLAQNRPNPFNPTTLIEYGLAQPSRVTIRIYDVSGRLVRELVDAPMPAGKHKTQWHGQDQRGAQVSSGVYYYELRSEGVSSRRRMVLLR